MLGRVRSGRDDPGARAARIREFLSAATGAGALAICSVLALIGCSTPTKPETPEIKEYVTVKAKVDADYTVIGGFGGTPVLGGMVKFEGNNTSKEAALGTETDLGQAVKGTCVAYTITITGNNVHKAIFNDTQITADGVVTSLKTDVIDTRTVDIPKFIRWILTNGNINWRWDYKGILQLSFNPDEKGTGARLADAYIIPTEKTVALIAQRSNGIISGIQSDRNGTYTYGTVPPDGEAITFYSLDPGTGVRNITYPFIGERVRSFAMFINPAAAQPLEVPGEVIDAFWQGNQNLDPSNPETSVWLWQTIELSFKRPAGNDQNYKIFLDHEERTGWPANLTSSINGAAPATDHKSTGSDDTSTGYGNQSYPQFSRMVLCPGNAKENLSRSRRAGARTGKKKPAK